MKICEIWDQTFGIVAALITHKIYSRELLFVFYENLTILLVIRA